MTNPTNPTNPSKATALTLCVVTSLLAVFAPAEARAATYCVGGAGASDSNDGLEAGTGCFATAQRAADKVKAGDVVEFRPGTYGGFSPAASGTASKPIIWRLHSSASPGQVTFSDQAAGDKSGTYGMITVSGSWQEFHELHIDPAFNGATCAGINAIRSTGSNLLFDDVSYHGKAQPEATLLAWTATSYKGCRTGGNGRNALYRFKGGSDIEFRDTYGHYNGFNILSFGDSRRVYLHHNDFGHSVYRVLDAGSECGSGFVYLGHVITHNTLGPSSTDDIIQTNGDHDAPHPKVSSGAPQPCRGGMIMAHNRFFGVAENYLDWKGGIRVLAESNVGFGSLGESSGLKDGLNCGFGPSFTTGSSEASNGQIYRNNVVGDSVGGIGGVQYRATFMNNTFARNDLYTPGCTPKKRTSWLDIRWASPAVAINNVMLDPDLGVATRGGASHGLLDNNVYLKSGTFACCPGGKCTTYASLAAFSAACSGLEKSSTTITGFDDAFVTPGLAGWKAPVPKALDLHWSFSWADYKGAEQRFVLKPSYAAGGMAPMKVLQTAKQTKVIQVGQQGVSVCCEDQWPLLGHWERDWLLVGTDLVQVLDTGWKEDAAGHYVFDGTLTVTPAIDVTAGDAVHVVNGTKSAHPSVLDTRKIGAHDFPGSSTASGQPSCTAPKTVDVVAGAVASLTITCTTIGAPKELPSLTIDLTQLPAGNDAAATDKGAGATDVRWTTLAADVGSYVIAYLATNKAGSTSGSSTIKVTAAASSDGQILDLGADGLAAADSAMETPDQPDDGCSCELGGAASRGPGGLLILLLLLLTLARPRW